MLSKSNLFSHKHPTNEVVAARLLDIFALGVARTNRRELAIGGLMFSLLSPVGLIMSVPLRIAPLALVTLLWWLIRNPLQLIQGAEQIFVATGLFLVFYKDLEQMLSEFLKGMLIACTAGAFLKWVCEGYIQRKPFRQSVVESEQNVHAITVLVGILESSYQRKYNNLIRLYLASKTKEGEAALMANLKEDLF